jgi:hypothetical protein
VSSPSDAHSDHLDGLDADEKLAKAVDELAAIVQKGDEIGIRWYLHCHPQFASALQALLPTIRTLVFFDDSGAFAESENGRIRRHVLRATRKSLWSNCSGASSEMTPPAVDESPN